MTLPISTANERAGSAAAAPRDGLGCATQQLLRDQELCTDGLRAYRKTTAAGASLGRVETPPSGRGLLVGVSLATGHRRRILQAHHTTQHDFDRGSIYLRPFDDRYRADLCSGFDFVLLELSADALDGTRQEHRGSQGTPWCTPGTRDEVLLHLALALAPALATPRHASRLFLDQLVQAMTTHVLQRHAGSAAVPRAGRRRLGARQEARAKELLRANLSGDLSIAEIAEACRLSRSGFSEAFRATTGQTPHRWLVTQRLERARRLLGDARLTLAEIAADCGFADQSHFTRVFTRELGLPPGRWRRERTG